LLFWLPNGRNVYLPALDEGGFVPDSITPTPSTLADTQALLGKLQGCSKRTVGRNRCGVAAAVKALSSPSTTRSRLDFFAGVLGHAKSPFIDRFDVESPVAAYPESRQFLLPREPVNR
jgi:hypothetical protein